MAEEDQVMDASNGGFGAMITQKIVESVKNMDIAAVLQKMAESSTDDEEAADAQSKIKSILEKYHSMGAEEKEQFTSQIKNVLMSKMSERMKDRLSGLDETIQEAIINKLILVGVGGLVLVILVVFFGYKLYKSIKEKENKKEEKKKLKQMKKKK
ncbi:uncharacterized protein LOC105388772 isoform X1 [Plutella xylostella]|uniref:uncharacterized protein LOC105388772 isoform X1 n=1 Tax=Plutella xylostella TaxID=51655 RepID=UPI0020324D53|nr:uncharacterized protein LOC105388772 isoform X1 [Plutella xylostella]